jgi:hypothetical protein
MTPVHTEVVDVGRQEAGYRHVLAVAAQAVLSDVPPALRESPALIGQVAATPFTRVYDRRSRHEPLIAFDPRREHIDSQREMLGAGSRVRLLTCDVTGLPADVAGLGCVVNPFGLQEFPGRDGEYADAVRRRVRNDAILQTLDWGLTSYPDELTDLPGIADEIAFSARHQLAPFTAAQGWRLEKEVVFAFHFEHTGEEIAVILPPEAVDGFHRVVDPEQVVAVGSSIVYRSYRAA